MRGTEEGRGHLLESRLRLHFSSFSKARVSGIRPRQPNWVSVRSVSLSASDSQPASSGRPGLSGAGGIPNSPNLVCKTQRPYSSLRFPPVRRQGHGRSMQQTRGLFLFQLAGVQVSARHKGFQQRPRALKAKGLYSIFKTLNS